MELELSGRNEGLGGRSRAVRLRLGRLTSGTTPRRIPEIAVDGLCKHCIGVLSEILECLAVELDVTPRARRVFASLVWVCRVFKFKVKAKPMHALERVRLVGVCQNRTATPSTNCRRRVAWSRHLWLVIQRCFP